MKRLPRVFVPAEVQSLLNACTRLRDRLLLCLLYESGMRIGQALGLRHADIRFYDGVIEIVPRSNSNGALAKTRTPYSVHVSKGAMELYTEYLVHEYIDAEHGYLFVNAWGRPDRDANDLHNGSGSVPQAQSKDGLAGDTAHVPSYACDRSSACRLGRGVCPEAARACADPDHGQHVCAP